MTGLSNERVTLAQGDGSEIELIVSGTEIYATYETLDGFPVVYDGELEVFCYARVDAGRYASTGAPASGPPPAGVQRHAKESDDVRSSRIEERRAGMDRPASANSEETEP